MKFCRFVLSCMALCSLSFRASAQNNPPTASEQNACGPAGAAFTVEFDNRAPAPSDSEPGKALVFVVDAYQGALEPSAMPTVRLALDGSWMGATRGKSYIFFAAEPGRHRLCATGQGDTKDLENQRALQEFNAEAGKTYFFRLQTTNRAKGEAQMELQPMDAKDAKYLIADADHAIAHRKK